MLLEPSYPNKSCHLCNPNSSNNPNNPNHRKTRITCITLGVLLHLWMPALWWLPSEYFDCSFCFPRLFLDCSYPISFFLFLLSLTGCSSSSLLVCLFFSFPSLPLFYPLSSQFAGLDVVFVARMKPLLVNWRFVIKFRDPYVLNHSTLRIYQ